MNCFKGCLKKAAALIISAVMLTGGLTFNVGYVYAEPGPDIDLGTLQIGDDSLRPLSTAVRNDMAGVASTLPDAFDLRHVGGIQTIETENGRTKTLFSGGKNYVTQVKNQNPWGTCWAYGAIAAAETSILYENNITNEEYKAANGGKELDLSEKALAWYVYQPLTKADVCDNIPSSQIGEGIYPGGLSDRPVYLIGGFSYYCTSVFSSGTGPKREDYRFPGEDNEYPYKTCGKNGWTLYDAISDPVLREEVKANLRPEYFNVFRGKTEADFEEWFLDYVDKILKLKNGDGIPYTEFDDWSIPVDHEHRVDHNAAVLRESHILPSPAIRQGNKYMGTDAAAIAGIKKEISSGRVVAVTYYGDIAGPDEFNPDTTVINVQNPDPTWAQYSYDPSLQGTHVASIVGYDDHYSRSNFLQGIDPRTGEDRTPPGDGAFIIKNSWGSLNDETEGQHNRDDYGIDGSGYIYLSYYDKSIYRLESFSFYPSDEPGVMTSCDSYINQYDFLPVNRTATYHNKNEAAMANVFVASNDQKLTHISTQTNRANTRVDYEVYRLYDNPRNPRDGKLLERGRVEFENGGYHRIPLKNNSLIKAGARFSVVMTHRVDTDSDQGYDVTVNFGEETYTVEDPSKKSQPQGIVNSGESYLYTNGEWFDYTTLIESKLEKHFSEAGYGEISFDNFSIKAFGEPIPVSSVKLSKTSATLGRSQTLRLYSICYPAEAAQKDVIWESSDPGVASVDEKGTVKGISKGTSTITATAMDGSGKKATCKVTVTDKKVKLVSSLTLNKKSLTLKKGAKGISLTASVKPANAADKKVTWLSSDPVVATVTAKGRVTPKGAGKAVITAYAGGKKKSCPVTVTVPVTRLSLNKTKANLSKGKELTLSVTFSPQDATNRALTWKSSNKKVATVKDGTVKAVGKGTATITVTSKDAGKKKATCKVTVR